MAISVRKPLGENETIFTKQSFLEVWNNPDRRSEFPEHFEVVEGRIVETVPVGRNQNFVAGNTIGNIGSYIRRNKLGQILAAEPSFELTQELYTLLVPDVAFVSKQTLEVQPENETFFVGAPDLAIEIVSASNTRKEMRDKAAKYLEAGSRLVWIVYPAKKEVQVYNTANPTQATVLHEADTLSGEDVISGFSCQVAEFFEE